MTCSSHRFANHWSQRIPLLVYTMKCIEVSSDSNFKDATCDDVPTGNDLHQTTAFS